MDPLQFSLPQHHEGNSNVPEAPGFVIDAQRIDNSAGNIFALFANATSSTQEQIVGQDSFNTGVAERELGSQQKAIGSQEKAIASQEKAIGSQQKAIGSQQKAIGSQENEEARMKELAKEVKKTLSVQARLESATAIHSVFIATALGRAHVQLTSVVGAVPEHVDNAHKTNKVTFLHGSELGVHPELGFAHGQKIKVTDEHGVTREVTVRHLTQDEWKALSGVVNKFLMQINTAKLAREERLPVTEKAHHQRAIAVLHPQPKDHHPPDKEHMVVHSETKKKDAEKRIEKSVVQHERNLAREALVINFSMLRYLIRIAGEFVKFDCSVVNHLLDVQKRAHIFCKVPRTLFALRRDDPVRQS